MTLTLTGLLLLLVIAGICGAIGRALGGGARGGFLISIVVGFVGALLGMLVARQLHLPEVLALSVEGRPFPILWSIIGGALLVAIVNLMSRPVGRWRFR
ncbi:MAG TPA: GlsB/YeaQ/YmgE family stress response membrane protein [Polyangiaceae bacterium]|nr:GlsB/YeaQ/YmgE family stress response membrane protein [Polyangiaceae bacterium]